MGPAFVGAMMDLLTTSVDSVQKEVRTGGRYPTRALRIELMLNALAQAGHATEAARLRKTWEDVYGTNGTVADFKSDVVKVTCAIYKGPYRGHALTDIVSYTGDSYADVVIGEAAAQGDTCRLKYHTDPRRLFAGAQWLHENPQSAQDSKAYGFIVEQIGKRHAQLYRSDDGAPVANKAVIETEVTARADADRRSGRDLADLLAAATQAQRQED
jgi:hypothetical protein